MEKELISAEEQQVISLDELKESVNQQCNEILIEPINIDIANLEGIEYDVAEFQKGLNDYSYIAGAITALKNVGLNNENIIAYLTTVDVLKSNIKVAEIGKDSDIEVSKNQNALIAKNQI
jgi:hypothetical protein